MKATTLYKTAIAVCTLFALTSVAPAQSVQVRHDSKDSDSKATIEQTAPEKDWFVSLEAGYSSKYVFRGTDLTPNSDGIAFEDVHLSIKGFTVGVWMAQMIGDAVVPNNTATGEAGGGGGRPGFGGFNIPGVGTITDRDTAIMRSFRELDFYVSYFHSFGWLDLTVGNIAFFIDRKQVDFYEILLDGQPVPASLGGPFQATYPSIEDETFDRVFIGLSTHKIPYVVPSLTYYQTVYNDGNNPGIDVIYFDRNDELGGYLEGKLSASIPIIKDRLSLDPTALVSYSFDDRSEATGTLPTAVPLNGWNHAQVGAELVFHVTNHFTVTGFGNYAHHFAAPTGGTEKNMGWGGVKVSLNF
jgi:hypothetical protein